MTGATPQDYGLEHDAWRPGQRESIEFVAGIDQVGIIEAPTGSGKTSLARAASRDHRVVALMKTKFLQANNYALGYGFDPMYGKANYGCVYPLAPTGATVAECMYQDKSMMACPTYGECAYVLARQKAQISRRAALNYPFWMHVYKTWPEFDYLFCDEAHELPGLVREWAGITIDEITMYEWKLPQIPVIINVGQSLLAKSSYVPADRARSYLESVAERMKEVNAQLSRYAQDEPETRATLQRGELFANKIDATLNALSIDDRDWYIKSGPNTLTERGQPVWGFLCKPLTARYFFSEWFRSSNYKTVLMSGTIGDFATFAGELGIKSYQTTRVPSVYPPSTRPVFDLGVPRLGQKSKDTDWQYQADQIANAIKSCDPSWHGLIHVTSKMESQRLAARLHSRGLQDRIYVMPDRTSTEKQVLGWQNVMKKSGRDGKIAIAWSLWAGYDGTEERINIVAKTPYGYLGDEYQVARQRANGSLYLLEAAQMLVQGLGRVRRGRPMDYDTPDKRAKFVAIADGGWKWLRKYMSPDVLESVTTL